VDFTPHTEDDIATMLGKLSLGSTVDLYRHLPSQVVLDRPLALDPGLAEPDVMAMVDQLASHNNPLVCFAGGGIYDHFLPPVVRSLTMRPEFVTSYTPYQPEVSQGVLQLLFEFQSMVGSITGLPVANASLYDGATAVVEAVHMAVAATGRQAVWLSRGLSPGIRQAVVTMAGAQSIELVEHPLVDGRTRWSEQTPEPAALVLAQPNYLGMVESYDDMVSLAKPMGALAIASVDPMTLGLLRTPGSAGCDVAVAEGQPLGNPMSFGGPVVGLFATTRDHVRRLPGRLVGRTVDGQGRPGFVLTLRAREQDIRRQRATSNICTNQTLNAIGSAIHLAWLGPHGLRRVGELSAQKARYLAGRLEELPGVSLANKSGFLREFAVLLPLDPDEAVAAMAERGFLAGIPLGAEYPELSGGLLVAVTERRTRHQLDSYVDALKEVIAGG
jgi:glycine dehydrogenase subunit 1